MSGPDLGKMLEQAQRMQERMASLQEELALRRYEASSGGGMASAVVTGQLRVLELRIEPGLVKDGDTDMIQDLAAAAVNAALEKAQQGVQEELGRLQQSMGLPNMPGMGGPT
ncbi:MAG: YbaB/EbfC family nucleoid-associated protein [Myxococcota bacterium]|nr:YbaB/EbfC family nucleoid-associated protein [Myxococcota bacterium]